MNEEKTKEFVLKVNEALSQFEVITSDFHGHAVYITQLFEEFIDEINK